MYFLGWIRAGDFMDLTKRKMILTGNWKMYKTIPEAVRFVNELGPKVKHEPFSVYLAVPFTAIKTATEAARDTSIVIGAQNMNDASEGAFTGEIAGKMLVDAGAKFVLLGHSERRNLFYEDNQYINRKVKRALLDGLQPVLCTGETLQQREEGKTEDVLKSQIFECLDGLSKEDISSMILAYEPVWAIGTGQIASSDAIEKAHQYCRQVIAEKWGEELSERISIQYGGSVREINVKEIISLPNVDGFLVGGASLSIESFSQIMDNLYKIVEQHGEI